MSYEKFGMGWSEIPWWGWANASLCSRVEGENSREVCFPSSEEAIARENNCVEGPGPITGGRSSCTDDHGRSGHVWCCRPGYPRPYYTVPATPQPGAPESDIPPLPSIPEFKAPTPGEGASFFEKLQHPGALIAIGIFSFAGILGYYTWRNR